MEVKEIIENLKYNNERKFQKESIIEARKNKEEVTEELLKELEKVADNIGEYAKKDDYMLLLYAIFLLAEFREKRAYPIIIKIITNKNQKEVDYLLGDVITGHLRKILASTNDGNIDVLYNIITNLEINEYIRGEAFKTLEILQKYNILKQEQIINFIEKALDNELKDDNTIVITDIVTYIAENKIYNKIGLVQKLYQEHRVNESMIGGYDDFIDEIYGNREPLEEKDMVEDTIEELSWWACFDKNDDKDIDFNKMMKDLMAFENTQVKKEMKEIKETKEIGRNDLCPCGSGKKYKKCCMNKKELEVITPADLYIQKSLQGYPKEELKKFYDEEAVAIDEKLYQVLKHKAVPLWIDRNYTEEMRRNTKSMNEAIELIKEKCEKDKINTLEEFDKSIAIHYNFEQIIYGYFKILDNTKNVYLETIQDKKREFLLQVIDIFDIKEEDKKRYINYIIDKYIEEEYYSEAIEEINKFKIEMPEIEKFLNVKISQAYLEDYRSIEEVLKPLEETIQKFGLDEELEIRRMELYYDYILQNYYEDEEDDEENEIELCQKLWQFVKDFVKTRNIVLEKEYDEKQEAEYYYSNIIYRIDNVYKNNSAKYIDQRMKFLDEAMNLMELGQESKEILVGGLVDTYCDMHKEDDAIKLIDEFIIDFPNSSNAILIKSDIYSGKDNPDYESAIRIVEEALKNDEIDCEYNLIAKLALLYDECGNEEKAREYQELAVSKGEWDLPF